MLTGRQFAVAFAVLGLLVGFRPAGSAGAPLLNEPIQPLPRAVSLDVDKIALGEKLFHDKRLSLDETVACASCHPLSKGGADGLATSVGIGGRVGALNAPTVFNAAFNIAQFWDGRALTLEAQMDGPVHAESEMGSSWSLIATKLRRDQDYTVAFGDLYGGLIEERTIKDAIATFERSLITPDAPFDRYLRGDESAINALTKEGYRLFKSFGCVACHQGMKVCGNMFQRFGIMVGERNVDQESDVPREQLGRFNITGRDRDKYVFKVPSLRNVAATAPYFHDGSVDTLEGAIITMAQLQLGLNLTLAEATKIASFLNSLTGMYRGRAVGSE